VEGEGAWRTSAEVRVHHEFNLIEEDAEENTQYLSIRPDAKKSMQLKADESE